MNLLNSIQSKLHGSVNPNSVQYIRQQDLKVQLDPSGTDFVDYTGQSNIYNEAHSLNPLHENSTALTILEKSPSTSPFSLASQNQYTIYLKYKVQDTNKPLIGHYFSDSRYDLSINNTIFYTGDTIQITVLKASDSTVDYAITGDLTTANLNNTSLTGTLSNIVSSLQYSILSGNGNFTFSLTGVSPTQQLIATIYRKYWVKVVTNWANQTVFAFSGSGPSGIYYEQPDLSFNTGDYLLFDQSDESNASYPIVFGVTKDDTSNLYTTGVTVVGTPGQTGAYTRIDYTGTTALFYFSSGAINMGYAPWQVTDQLSYHTDSTTNNISGSSLTNLVNSSNNATFNGSMSYETNIGGRPCYYLPRNKSAIGLTDAAIQLPQNLPTNSCTFSAYFYRTTDTIFLWSTLAGFNTGNSYNSVLVGSNAPQSNIAVFDVGGGNIYTGNTIPMYEEWIHFCITYYNNGSSSSGNIYINGVHETEYSNTTLSISRYTIGLGTFQAGFYLNDVRVYDKILSDSEVSSLYGHISQ